MALKPREIQDFQPSGKQYHDYDLVADKLVAGSALQLVADPSNTYDAKAVKVMYQGKQIGWVPKGENADIAARLRRGEKLEAEVRLHHSSVARLEVRVYFCGPAEPLDMVSISQASPSGKERGERFPCRPQPGATFGLRSHAGRSSVTITSSLQRDLAWFDRSLLTVETLTAIDKGRGMAVWDDARSRFEIWDNRHARPDRIDTGGQQAGKTSRAQAWAPEEIVPMPRSEYELPEPPEAKISQPQKETTMSLNNKISATVTNTVDFNKKAAAAAGYNEAGRIANNQLTKVASKALPMMIRGYSDTPIGRLVIANIAQMAAAQLRPNDPTLQRLTFAMTTAAYQEVIQTIDIEGMLNGLLETPELQRALSKLPKDDDAQAGATFNFAKD